MGRRQLPLLFAALLVLVLGCLPIATPDPKSSASQTPTTPNPKSLALITKICSETTNVPLCHLILSPGGRVAGVTLKELAKIARKPTWLAATKTYKLIILLIKLERKPKTRRRFRSCLKDYVEAIRGLGEWDALLKSGNYSSLHTEALAIAVQPVRCDHKFAQPPSEPGVSANTSNDLISDVCKRTRTPRLCLQILKSNVRARKASSPLQLGEVSMDLSKSSAKATKNMILFSSLRTKDKGLKERYKSCAVNYDSALYYINIANQYLKGGDFASVGRYIAAALNEPISCRHNFATAEPAGLKEGNDKLECLCSVVLVISDRLSGKHCSFPAGEYLPKV
ncbi:hypothetical protein Salat_1793700 [Sesamum alatum]|uniref:Pectinesterase inhibitor domain-containing protein n=1 Tax=Sesamum alatum TaxID=300844 RepID=A0AAE1Y9R3_9LAMI|nr:hypothetical protein Salat_1793700 [Sesamum alatum]